MYINLLIILKLSHYIVFGLGLCLVVLLLLVNFPTLFQKNKESPNNLSNSKENQPSLNFFSSNNNAFITNAKTINIDDYCLHLIDMGNGKILLVKDFLFEPSTNDQKQLDEILNTESKSILKKETNSFNDNYELINESNKTSQEKEIINSFMDEALSMKKIMNEASVEDFGDSFQIQKELYDIEVKGESFLSENLVDEENVEENNFLFEITSDTDNNDNI